MGKIRRSAQGEGGLAPQLTGRALKRELANAGFTRSFRTRYRGWITVAIIGLIVAAVLAKLGPMKSV
jgi:hypothetical protein